MFVDEAEIIFRSGDGGSGRVSFLPGKRSGPDGGNGGDGGNLFVRVSESITNLNNFAGKSEIAAENGEEGGTNNKTGRRGEDKIVDLPIGTHLINLENLSEIELKDKGQLVLICTGGKGGRGNYELRSSRNTTPTFATKGTKGEKKKFKLHIKLIADFGLIGLPNAGKSSLLNELTNANAKVADYAFTTIEPNLGVIGGKVIADIPGLIEGAHIGRGLGINFLKHIEKVKLLIHCISSESDDVLKGYKIIMGEMVSFNPELKNKKQIILLTKSDLISKKELAEKIKKLKIEQNVILGISIYDWESLERLKKRLDKI